MTSTLLWTLSILPLLAVRKKLSNKKRNVYFTLKQFNVAYHNDVL